MAPTTRKIPRLPAGLFLLGSLNFLMAGCTTQPMVDLSPIPVPPEKTVVMVNGEPLSLEEFDNEFRLMAIHYGAVTEGDMRVIKRRLFEQVINRRLLVQAARKIGLKLTQAEVESTFREALKDNSEGVRSLLKIQGVSEESWKRKLLQERLARKLVDQEVNSKVDITPQEVEDYYWFHLSDYWQPEAVRARHLVFQKKADLQKTLDGLSRGEDLARMAALFSAGPDKANGGDWGFMAVDRIPETYFKVLKVLKVGEISKPLKDEFGYHLFQLFEWRPKKMRTFAEARDLIHDSLMKEEQDQRFDQWMAELKRKATIKVNQDMAPVVGVTLEGFSEE